MTLADLYGNKAASTLPAPTTTSAKHSSRTTREPSVPETTAQDG